MVAYVQITPLGGQDLTFRQISVEDESVPLSRAFLGHHVDRGGLLWCQAR